MNILQEQGRALYKRGEYRKAIDIFNRAIGRAASAQLLDSRAACYEKLDELSAALKDAKQAIQLHREDATGYLRAGKVLVKMEKQSVALEIYTHGLKCIKHVGQGYELLRKAHKELMDELCPPKSVDPLTVLPRELAEVVLDHLSFRQLMNACLVSKQWAQFIRSIPNLWQHLDLSGARKKVRSAFISRAINTGKSKLTKATLKDLYDFEKTLAALIKHCPLEELEMRNYDLLGNSLLPTWRAAKHLKALRIRVKDTMVAGNEVGLVFKELSERLELFECNVALKFWIKTGGVVCQHLHTFSTEIGLDLCATDILQNAPSYMPSLRSLTLHQKPQLHSHPLRRSERFDLSGCAQLESLDLSITHRVDDVFKFPPSLVRLRLAPMRTYGTATWESVAGPNSTVHLPKLKELTLESWGEKTADLMSGLVSRRNENASDSDTTDTTPKLRKLSIADSSVDWIYCKDLDPRLDDLEELSMKRISFIRDYLMPNIPERFPKLRHLDLTGTEVTGVGIKDLLRLEHLESLVLDNCRFLATDAVEWARSKGVHVQYRMKNEGNGGRKIRY